MKAETVIRAFRSPKSLFPTAECLKVVLDFIGCIVLFFTYPTSFSNWLSSVGGIAFANVRARRALSLSNG